MEVSNIYVWILVIVLVFQTTDGRSTAEQEVGKEEEPHFQFKVITKRDVSDVEQTELPKVAGSTFKASEPLDPNSPVGGETESQNIYEHFDTVNTIYQPEIDGKDSGETEPEYFDDLIKEGGAPENFTQEDDKKTERVSEGGEQEYGAQYPYAQTVNTGQGFQERHETRRVALLGRSGTEDNSYGTRRAQTYGGFAGEERQPSGSTYTTERRLVTGRGAGDSYSSYQRGGYQPLGQEWAQPRTSGTQTRGAYYSGPVYVDSNGHYIDANGRHLDSTGRYYDTSGRFQDATVTRTVTYSGSASPGTRYVDREGTSYGYGGQTYSQGRPVNSYGGNQFYSSSTGNYPATYDPVVSQISSDPNCPVMNTRVTINGLSCTDAVAQVGRFVCYNYERVSTECCERCLQVKRSEKVGCEYGDRSSQCRNLNAHDCYNERNRQICCERCAQLENRGRETEYRAAGCEYGDFTPRCASLVQTPHLCYLPENQRVCCQTCPRLARNEDQSCRWGNQNPEFCDPFDAQRRLKINCYVPAVQEVCCSTCKSLRERIPDTLAGCEYGDSPTLFRTSRGNLDCREYIRQYGMEQCDTPQTGRACCFTCHRYRQHYRG